MYPVLRTLMVWWRARSAPPCKVSDRVETRLTVSPFDLDLNLHMNNGRFLTLMDLGRYDMIFRAGLLPEVRRRGWFPVLATASIRFRRSLRAFEKITLTTQIVYWDEKWFYFQQEVHRGTAEGELASQAVVKGLFRDAKGPVPIAQMLEVFGVGALERPPMPDLVRYGVEPKTASAAVPIVSGAQPP